MTNKKMFYRMIMNALMKRKSRVMVSLLAIAIGTSVVAALLSVYVDINEKMSKEFRSYGANMVLSPADRQEKYFSYETFRNTLEVIGKDAVGAAPYLYGVATVDKHRLVVVGTSFHDVKKVSPYWKITGEWVEKEDAKGAMIGITAADKLRLKPGDTFTMSSEAAGQQEEFTVKALVNTGSTEDNQIFINLDSAQVLLNTPDRINAAYLSVMGSADFLSEKAKEFERKFPVLSAKPIKKIAKSEGVILEKIKSLVYMVVFVILLSTLLCVTTTMMTMVTERKGEIGLKKALGADNFYITKEFIAEALLLGAGGAVIGNLSGYGLAQVIGRSVFDSLISIKPLVFLGVFLVSLVVTCAAALWPLRMATAVDPVIVLKDE
ncbi:MAG: ABC transporter permease [Bacillota bacterium]